MRRRPVEERIKAREMRAKGASLNKISVETGVPKSTLSIWTKDIPNPDGIYFTNRNEWLGKIRKLAVKAKRKMRLDRIQKTADEVRSEVNSWDEIKSLDCQKIILASLYWAEGLREEMWFNLPTQIRV